MVQFRRFVGSFNCVARGKIYGNVVGYQTDVSPADSFVLLFLSGLTKDSQTLTHCFKPPKYQISRKYV